MSPASSTLWCVIGRRGGKSRAIAALLVYLATMIDYRELGLDEARIKHAELRTVHFRQSRSASRDVRRPVVRRAHPILA